MATHTNYARRLPWLEKKLIFQAGPSKAFIR
jgi:hypothetical protein